MNDDIVKAEHRCSRPGLCRISLTPVAIVIAGWTYVATHPLVLNESFLSHVRCISQVGLAFRQSAREHFGQFPAHTHGSGDALLLLLAEGCERSHALTGPGYGRFVFDRALTNRTDLPESECRRVYVQGLRETSNPEIVLLFDKLPSPGGDHCHGLARLRAPLCREVAFVDGSHRTVREADWPEFFRKQVVLLVQEGFSNEQAEAIYAEKGRQH